jgi:hypothetical protein
MLRIGAVLLALAVVGCASGGNQGARDLPRAPRTWTPDEREAARPAPMPPPRGGPGGYPEGGAAAPLYVVPESRWSAVGPGAAEARRLAGRGPAFMKGVEVLPDMLRLRDAVWAHGALPAAAGADSVVFATPWVPAGRLAGELQCEPGQPGAPVRARLVGRFRVAGAHLLIKGWMETDGAAGCMGSGAARDRVRAFADDLERFARDAARRGVPVPLPGD